MNQRVVLVMLCLLVVGLWLIQPPTDKIVFLDVGQGDAILLQAGLQQVLIDGGPDGAVLTRLSEELPWFDQKIEVVIATHPDKDHIGGLVHVLERYDVGLVILPHVSHTSNLQAAWLDHLQKKLDSTETQYRFATAGQTLQLADLELSILHPERGQNFGNKTNNASVSVRGDYRDLSFLFTGDAESVIERELVTTYGSLLNVDLLKAGHHGSKTSTSPALLSATTPNAVVISAGRDNQYGHPHPDVMARLAQYRIWRTDQQGSIRFLWGRGSWLVASGTL